MSLPLRKDDTSRARILSKPDRRRHRRVALTLNGRFLFEGSDHTFLTDDISCGSANLEAVCIPPVGSKIVCYFDDLGRVAADVTRRTEKGFAIRFNAPQHKTDKIADRLVWLLNHEKYDLEDERNSPRKAAGGPALVTRENGTKIQCRVIDISLIGAAFEFDGPVPVIGEKVRVGTLKGEVVRAVTGEFAIRFIQAPKT